MSGGDGGGLAAGAEHKDAAEDGKNAKEGGAGAEAADEAEYNDADDVHEHSEEDAAAAGGVSDGVNQVVNAMKGWNIGGGAGGPVTAAGTVSRPASSSVSGGRSAAGVGGGAVSGGSVQQRAAKPFAS